MKSTRISDRRVERCRALRSEVKAIHPCACENRIVRERFADLFINRFCCGANSFFARAMALMNEPDYQSSHVAHHIHDVRNLELAVLAGIRSEERKRRREELQAVVEKYPKYSVSSELYEQASEWTGVAVNQAWSKK